MGFWRKFYCFVGWAYPENPTKETLRARNDMLKEIRKTRIKKNKRKKKKRKKKT